MEQTIAYIGPEPTDADDTFIKLMEAIRRTGRLAVDTETVSLKDRDCIGIGVHSDGVGLYVSYESPLLSKVVNLLSDVQYTKIYFNAMFDLRVERILAYELDGADFVVSPPDCLNIADVSTMAHVQALPPGLSNLAFFILQLGIAEISDVLPARHNMLDLEFKTVAEKCLDDVKATWQLFDVLNGPWWMGSSAEGMTWQLPTIDRSEFFDPYRKDSYTASIGMKECYQVDMKLVPILLDMGERGIELREKEVHDWEVDLSVDKARLLDLFFDVGINPGSPMQVAYFLASRGNMLPMTKSKKSHSTKDNVLTKLNDPWAALVLEYRKVTKLKSTYIDPAVGQDRMYSMYRLDLSTGRLASSERNMQNIPVPVRNIFESDSGIWTIADASQIEMRCFAYLTQDPVLLKAYRDEADIHAMTQLALWPGSDVKNTAMRTRAKNFNFAMLADANPKVLSDTVGLPVQTCAEFKQIWYALYPESYPWIVRQEEEGYDLGYRETIYGRRMRLPEPPIANAQHVRKCSVNYPFQGSAADLVKRAMLMCVKAGLTIATQVHDEVLLDGDVEFPPEIENLHPELRVPYEVIRYKDWVKKIPVEAV